MRSEVTEPHCRRVKRKLVPEDRLERLKRVRDEYMRWHTGNLRCDQDEK
jgi:hypothetical protein